MTFDYGSYLKLSYWSECECIALLNGHTPEECDGVVIAERRYRDEFIERHSLQNRYKEVTEFDREYYLEQSKLSRCRRKWLKDARAGMEEIACVLARDIELDAITPDMIKGGIDYFVPKTLINWAVFKGYQVPTELMNFAWKAKAEQQAEAIVDDSTGNHAGAEPASTTAIQSNSNELDLSGLLNAPAKQDDWFNVIDDMTKSYFREYGKIPNGTQAWVRLSTVSLDGYAISAGIDNGEKCLIMPGVNPLSKSAFSKRWEKYTANKAQ